MLQAIISGKAARVSIDGESKSWRELFRTREDLITASVFGRLPYLSDALIRQCVLDLLGDEGSQMQDIGCFQDITFWPRYHKSENHRSFVEPDVLIEFSGLTLLIEVKPPWGQQDAVQWKREVRACIHDRIREDVPLCFLALGGHMPPDFGKAILRLEDRFKEEKLRIVLCSWQTLNRSLHGLIARADRRDLRILEDQLYALALHGVRVPGRPFTDLNNLPSNLSVEALESWHESLCGSNAVSHDWDRLNKINFDIREDLSLWR